MLEQLTENKNKKSLTTDEQFLDISYPISVTKIIFYIDKLKNYVYQIIKSINKFDRQKYHHYTFGSCANSLLIVNPASDFKGSFGKENDFC